ncbi:MAG: helix-hairpin-helix domain-containing protein [candidate division Zixibacteria bacterium]|nr:helix-hairpin-helix domain-containing protein [candidate division Zixibacteria bacterium]
MPDDASDTNDDAATGASPGETSKTAPSSWRRAGPYGFSRAEITALLVVCVVAGAFSFYQWWNNRLAAEGPEWPIEDVAIDTGPSLSPAFTARTVVPADTGSTRERAGEPRIDVNTALLADLVRLPGIGPELAQRIIHDRQERGHFVDLVDFQRVKGIGPKKAATLAGWIWFSAPDTSRLVTPDSVADP